MNRAALVTLAVLLAAGLSVPAAAVAKTPAQRIATLEKQVKTLQKQVKTLTGEVQANYQGDACLTAVTVDAFQATWSLINVVAGRTVFPAQSSIDDRGGCRYAEATRVAGQTPPPLTGFVALVRWLIEGN
jgi:hypothetical protein